MQEWCLPKVTLPSATKLSVVTATWSEVNSSSPSPPSCMAPFAQEPPFSSVWPADLSPDFEDGSRLSARWSCRPAPPSPHRPAGEQAEGVLHCSWCLNSRSSAVFAVTLLIKLKIKYQCCDITYKTEVILLTAPSVCCPVGAESTGFIF